MLTLKELSWGGCFSYGEDNKIQLNNANITQLLGENGAGKSSIALIVEEVLFNKNSKGIKKADIPNRLGDGSYWMDLSFDLSGRDFLIAIKRKGTLKVKLLENGVDISSHTATDTFKTIEETLGMDFKMFVPLIYQSTTQGLSFLTATDTNRKKFLIELFNLNEYDKYHTLFKELVQEASTSVSKVEGQVSAISSWIEKNKNVPAAKDPIGIPELEESDELWSLKDRLSKVKETNKRISDNNKYQEILKNINFDKELVSKSLERTSEYQQTVGELTSEIKGLKALIAKLNKLEDACPTCGQAIDTSVEKRLRTEAEADLSVKSELLKEVNKKLEEANSVNKAISEAKAKQSEWESLYVKIDRTLTKNLEDVGEIADKIVEIEASIVASKKKYDEAIAHNMTVEKHNSRISVILEQLEEHKKDLDKAKNRLKDITKELGLLEILKKTFSTNGLVAYKLENLIKDLEQLANEYLAELSDGRFTLEFLIASDKLNVKLTDNGAEIDISALSSGELARVNTSTLLAIRKLMNSISKTQINILFLDEVMNVLDEQGKERLVEVLLEEKNLNTFLVSHGWSHPLLEKITVTKTDGVSELKIG